MSQPIFDPQAQSIDLDAKIVVSLERIAEVFRVLLWNMGKNHKLSPLQIQLLIFLKFHDAEKCKVSYLAHEFSLTKPTISEAVRTLLKKELIKKETDPIDTRSYSIHLTHSGNKLVDEISFFANDLKKPLAKWKVAEKANFYRNILELISSLQKLGFIHMQRMCFNCRFYEKTEVGGRCQLLKKNLKEKDLRVDCPEFEEK